MIVRFLIAGVFSVVGVAGLLLPILPGWLFLGAAAVVLFPTSRMSNALFDRMEAKMPRFGPLVRRLVAGNRR